MERSQQTRSAFTLVELLVVVAVLAILGSLTISALSMARSRAYQSVCANNMRQVGMGLQMYASDHGKFPSTTHTSLLSQSWIYTIADYLDDVDEVRISPADPLGEKRLEQNGSSYILNSFMFVQEEDPFGAKIGKVYDRPSLIPNPAQTMLAFNISDRLETGIQSDHTHSSAWTSWGAMLSDIQPNRHGGSENDYTSGSANYLFADGHVESILASDVKAKVDKGENIAAVK